MYDSDLVSAIVVTEAIGSRDTHGSVSRWLAAAEEVSNLDPEEYVTLGPIPSTLMVHDIIGSDMAQVLYAIHGDWAGASIGEKIAYMQTIEIAMRDLPGQPATV